MTTYEQAILCPRCGAGGMGRVEMTKDDSPDERLIRVFCNVRQCSYYGRTWFFAVDPRNDVIYHTHTPYQGT